MNRITLPLLLLAVSVAATPAVAMAETPQSRAVRCHAADLRTEAGVKALRKQIALAIRSVCSVYATPAEPLSGPEQKCRAQTARAVEPRVTTAIASANSGDRLANADILQIALR